MSDTTVKPWVEQFICSRDRDRFRDYLGRVLFRWGEIPANCIESLLRIIADGRLTTFRSIDREEMRAIVLEAIRERATDWEFEEDPNPAGERPSS